MVQDKWGFPQEPFTKEEEAKVSEALQAHERQ
jgi:hypothetical protein